MGGIMSKVSELRRRRGAGRVHPEQDENGTDQMEQPLLSAEEAAAAPRRSAAEQRELPWALAAVARALSAAWNFLLGLLRRLLPSHRRVAPLSPLQQERLEGLRRRAAETFDGDAAEHQLALGELWSVAFSGSPLEPEGIKKHEQWKELGFQSDLPARDLSRGAGVITLDSLLWMARHRRASFLRLSRKTEGTRSEWEYPFAAGGMNVAHMLCEVLDLRGQRGAPPATPAARGFLPLLGASGTAFEELFEVSYRLLDTVWLDQQASYMQFPLVLREVRSRVEKGLASSRFETMAELQQLLLPGVLS